ncbi:Phosphoinositide 3-phosphatase [Nakaseomyces bracarensis]|uniref:Phosphoinositide 3-phosphatase n=1 Tax=Nakaseomyces bracarensis TaxID=273131 RepID=A0ABR4NQ47_9SACH
MEYIKVSKVDEVTLHRRGKSNVGTLHLTTHHLIFTSESLKTEFWFAYHLIGSVFKNYGSALLSVPGYDIDHKNEELWSMTNIKVIGKEFTVFSLDFRMEIEASEVYESLLNLTVLDDIQKLYAFIYTPNKMEEKLAKSGHRIFDPVNEFHRQGIVTEGASPNWRFSEINSKYELIPTYPSFMVVPTTVSDSMLQHAMKFRSQNRLPALTYYYKKSSCSLLRSAQPLTGLTKQRSPQDEKLLLSFFKTSNDSKKNLIVDARPTANAYAQMTLGGGTESMDNYNFNKTSQRLFLGIDNIHVMSDTINNLVDNFLTDGDIAVPIDSTKLSNGKAANWLKYIRLILSSTEMLAKSMIFNKSNILLHCSDGWDRTAQVGALLQICLDPYFRTFEGFMVLIEKDWIAFGHKFRERLGHLSSTSVFHDNTSGITGNITLNYKKITGNDSLSRSTAEDGQNIGTIGLVSETNTATSTLNKGFQKFSNTASNLFNKTINEINTGHVGDADEKGVDQGINSEKPKKKKTSTKFVSPVFLQFLDCVYQLMNQEPTLFEFNERFLRRLVYHSYSCQYGTFLYNCQKELVDNKMYDRTASVWDYFISRKAEFINHEYAPNTNNTPGEVDVDDWILPDLKKVKWWWQMFGRKNSEMNSHLNTNKLEIKPDVNVESLENLEEKTLSAKIASFGLDFFGKK